MRIPPFIIFLIKIAFYFLYCPYSRHLLIIKQGYYKLKGIHIPNLQRISWLLALSASLTLLALLSVLLTLLLLVSKSKLTVSSSITIGFAASRQNYIFRTARKRGRVIG